MFLLDLKGTRERSPRSQCRGGPAQGREMTAGRAGMCLGIATVSPLPPRDPRTWEPEGRITMVEPDLQGHPSCLGLGRGLLLAGLTTEVSNSTLMEGAGGSGSREGPKFHPNLPLRLTQ